jgi:hypothetical protein
MSEPGIHRFGTPDDPVLQVALDQILSCHANLSIDALLATGRECRRRLGRGAGLKALVQEIELAMGLVEPPDQQRTG